MSNYVNAREASARLGVSRATLYSYVSRGLVRSRAVTGRRSREYLSQDLAQLVRQKAARLNPKRSAVKALGFEGLPVLESQLTLIDQGRLYYRGRDVMELSRRGTLLGVAELLWGGELPVAASLRVPVMPARLTSSIRGLGFIPEAQCFLAWLESQESERAVSAEHLRVVGLHIAVGLFGVAAPSLNASQSLCVALAQAWGLPASRSKLLEAALILCADHELNVSAFTARTIASSGASMYMALSGALGALSGERHGGQTKRVAALLDQAGPPRSIVTEALSRSKEIPGFAHPLYPSGDPRCRRLMALCPPGAAKKRAVALARAVKQLGGVEPNLDLGLVTLSRALVLPAEAPLMLFALGRAIGWVGHCIEQYGAHRLIRPRASYTGPPPTE